MRRSAFGVSVSALSDQPLRVFDLRCGQVERERELTQTLGRLPEEALRLWLVAFSYCQLRAEARGLCLERLG